MTHAPHTPDTAPTPADTPPARGVRRAAGPRTRLFALGVVLACLVTDQVSKALVLTHLDDGAVHPLLGRLLSLRLLHNSGAAFSLGADSTLLLTGLAVVITVGASVALWRTHSARLALVLALLVGGSLGNLVDRFVRAPGIGRGHVVDFIDYAGFFVGNVADVWIVVGALGLGWVALTEDRGGEEGSARG